MALFSNGSIGGDLTAHTVNGSGKNKKKYTGYKRQSMATFAMTNTHLPLQSLKIAKYEAIDLASTHAKTVRCFTPTGWTRQFVSQPVPATESQGRRYQALVRLIGTETPVPGDSFASGKITAQSLYCAVDVC